MDGYFIIIRKGGEYLIVLGLRTFCFKKVLTLNINNSLGSCIITKKQGINYSDIMNNHFKSSGILQNTSNYSSLVTAFNFGQILHVTWLRLVNKDTSGDMTVQVNTYRTSDASDSNYQIYNGYGSGTAGTFDIEVNYDIWRIDIYWARGGSMGVKSYIALFHE